VSFGSSEKEPARDRLGNFAKFNTPTVANGKVYVSTFSNPLVVYGLFNDGVNVSMNPAEAALTSSQIQHQPASAGLRVWRDGAGSRRLRHAVEKKYRFFSYGDCMLIV